MDWLRQKIGLAEPPPPPRKTAPARSAEDAAAAESELMRAQTMQLGMLKSELADVEHELGKAVKLQQKAIAKNKLHRRNALQAQIRELEGKMENAAAARKMRMDAHANVEQALLMKDGAAELTTLVDDMEHIDLNHIVDQYKDAGARNQEFSHELSAPLFDTPMVSEDGLDVDDELNQIMSAGLLQSVEPTPTVVKPQVAKPTVVKPAVENPL